MLGVGAAFDTQAGLRRRAPSWVQAIALEWLFRLLMEPRRLWRRYLIGNTQFIGLVLRQWVRERFDGLTRRIRKLGAAKNGEIVGQGTER
jgi:N-acetylglucosaminyldiphosphoundecaprenol N-acetyl-beta-D-mannosaminyltransferase